MTTVGILGGGQLARMMALAGAPLGLRFSVMDTSADACAGQFAPLVVGAYRDGDALARFASGIDIATFDFENVPADSAQWLSERVPLYPNPHALGTSQDRLAEKTLFGDLGIPLPGYAPVDTREDLDAAVATLGAPCILKTRRLGYDGKGQFRIRTADDAAAAWEALGAQAATVGLILEAFVPFERELSVVAVRGRDGEFRTWPLTENWHVGGVLSASLAPARVDPALEARAVQYARALAEALDYVGVFALELFCHDGELLRTKWRRGCTTQATGRSKAPRPRSSATTCARCSACRWVRRARWARAACSTGSARCRIPRRCWRKPADTGMTTARPRVRAARLATPRCAPIAQRPWPKALSESAWRWVVKPRSPRSSPACAPSRCRQLRRSESPRKQLCGSSSRSSAVFLWEQL